MKLYPALVPLKGSGQLLVREREQCCSLTEMTDSQPASDLQASSQSCEKIKTWHSFTHVPCPESEQRLMQKSFVAWSDIF